MVASIAESPLAGDINWMETAKITSLDKAT